MHASPKRQPLRQASTQSCGLALCVAALLGSEADGSTTILYTDTTDITLLNRASKGPVGSVSFDPNHDTGTAPDYAIESGNYLVGVGYDYFFSWSVLFVDDSNVSTISLNFLTEGQEIGTGLSYTSEFLFESLPLNEDAYLGLSYLDGVNYYYGWARFNRTSDGPQISVTLKDFAMEQSPNTSILAGAIPEPTSMLLTLGALGLATLRRRVVR